MVAEASIRGSEGFSFKDFACLVSRGMVTVISFCLFMSFFLQSCVLHRQEETWFGGEKGVKLETSGCFRVQSPEFSFQVLGYVNS